ncbi:hypothetical protein ABZ746_37120 [Streptomyces sp. NPDC020096]
MCGRLSNTLAAIRLLPMSGGEKDVEILALRNQLAVMERQLPGAHPRFTPEDRALLAALLHHLPQQALRQMQLLVRPDTVLRWLPNVDCQAAAVTGGVTR